MCFSDGPVSGSIQAVQSAPETRRVAFAVWHRWFQDQRQTPGPHHVQDGTAGHSPLQKDWSHHRSHGHCITQPGGERGILAIDLWFSCGHLKLLVLFWNSRLIFPVKTLFIWPHSVVVFSYFYRRMTSSTSPFHFMWPYQYKQSYIHIMAIILPFICLLSLSLYLHLCRRTMGWSWLTPWGRCWSRHGRATPPSWPTQSRKICSLLWRKL